MKFFVLLKPLLFLIVYLGVAVEVQALDPLRIAVPYLPEKIDVRNYSDPVNRIILENISLKLDHKLNAEGGGITDSLSREGDSVSILLKPNLAFQHGGTITSRDLKELFEFWKNLASRERDSFDNQRLAAVISDLSSVKQYLPPSPARDLGNLQAGVLIEFSSGQPEALETILELPLIDASVASSFADEFGRGTSFTGAGPFFVKQWSGQEKLVLEKNRHFHLPGYPLVELVEFEVFETAELALSALRVGGVDIIAFATPGLVEKTSTNPTLRTVNSPLENLKKDSDWKFVKNTWGRDSSSEIIISKLILRKSLVVDKDFKASFNLAGCFLP